MAQSSMKGGPVSRRAAELIRQSVRSSDLSVTAIAERAGMNRSTLQNVIAGKANVYVEHMVLLAQALDVDAAEWVAVIEAERRERKVLRPSFGVDAKGPEPGLDIASSKPGMSAPADEDPAVDDEPEDDGSQDDGTDPADDSQDDQDDKGDGDDGQ